MIADDDIANNSRPFYSFALCLVSMMGLRLSPIGRRVSVMMMVVVMMTLLIGDAGVLARWIRSDIADDQFRAVTLGIVTAEILPVSWLI